MYGSVLSYQLENWRAGADIDAASVEDAIDGELPFRVDRISSTAADDPGDVPSPSS